MTEATKHAKDVVCPTNVMFSLQAPKALVLSKNKLRKILTRMMASVGHLSPSGCFEKLLVRRTCWRVCIQVKYVWFYISLGLPS